MTRRLLALCALAVVLAAPVASHAHGDIQSTSPEDGARVTSAPSIVRISFTEAPTADGRFEVIDGCGDDIVAEVAREGANAELLVDAGQPGAWKVSYRVISSVDGHSTRGSFGFRVAGPSDCSDPEPVASDTPEIDGQPPFANDDAPSDFPVLPVVIGGGAIVALAVAVRIFSAR
jgi:methionine-rich copper-binding protein CopC